MRLIIEPMRGSYRDEVDDLVDAAWLATYPSETYHITKEDCRAFRMRRRMLRSFLRAERFGLQREGEYALVARIGDGVAGICHSAVRPGYNQLQALYVHPAYLRHGVGTALWHAAKQKFDPRLPTLVWTAIYNQRAIAFYKTLGFKPAGEVLFDETFRFQKGVIIPQIKMVTPGS